MNGVSPSIWLIAAVLIVAPPATAQQEQPSSADFSSLRSLIDSQIAAGVPGIAVAIAPRTPFYLASVSKTITSTALMHLVAQNKLALDRDALVSTRAPSGRCRPNTTRGEQSNRISGLLRRTPRSQ
jgi:beta-lactamase class A